METRLRVRVAAVPPPGFVAIGMALTATPEPPDVRSTRCVPKQWTRRATAAPALVWENAGGGGRAASVWIVNELGVAHVVLGHEPPDPADCLELVPAARCSPRTSWRRNRRTRDRVSAATTATDAPRFAATRCRPPRLRSASGPTCTARRAATARPPLRGRAAMFESVAEEAAPRTGGARRARTRRARTRGRRRVAALGAVAGRRHLRRHLRRLRRRGRCLRLRRRRRR